MIPGSYEQILDRISKSSGLDRSEIERKIEVKRAKLSGLISKEGAAQIVASELGISFEKEKMKISELLTGMRRINLTGKVIQLNKVIEYNKNGREGKIGSFLLADDTGSMRIVLWDTNHISLIEKGEIKEGDVIQINGGDVRNGEMHISGFGDLKKSKEVINNIVEKPITRSKFIKDILSNENVSVRAFVVQIYGPNFFYTCPECNKKVEANKCSVHGMVVGRKRAIINFILDDGSSTIRSTLFDEQAKKVATEEELVDNESFMKKREDIIGQEFIIEASARKNRLSEEIELIVNDVRETNIEELIKLLEAK